MINNYNSENIQIVQEILVDYRTQSEMEIEGD
jgi:hypothetical protein